MSNIALDEHGNEITAISAPANHTKRTFYCPNPECPATLQYISPTHKDKAVKSPSPYFRNTDSRYKHISGCPYFSSIPANLNKLTTNGFDLNLFIDRLSVSSGLKKGSTQKKFKKDFTDVTKTHLIRTLRELYDFCTHHALDYIVYGKTTVNEILLSARNAVMYRIYIKGYRIIECKYHNYSTENLSIYFQYPASATQKPVHRIQAKFNNADLYYKFQKKLYSEDNTKPVVCIAGDWHYSIKSSQGIAEYATCLISSASQIIVV
jgi:hypothetical protein